MVREGRGRRGGAHCKGKEVRTREPKGRRGKHRPDRLHRPNRFQISFVHEQVGHPDLQLQFPEPSLLHACAFRPLGRLPLVLWPSRLRRQMRVHGVGVGGEVEGD